MLKQIGRIIAIQLGIATAIGIAIGIGIGILISRGSPSAAHGIIEEHTASNFNHDAQEFRTTTCLVWWQSATPEGNGKILSCERIYQGVGPHE